MKDLSGVILVDSNINATLHEFLPLEIYELSNQMRWLHFSHNDLSGTLPTKLGSLTLLEELYLNDNYALTGTLPSELGLLTGMRHLFAHKVSLCFFALQWQTGLCCFE